MQTCRTIAPNFHFRADNVRLALDRRRDRRPWRTGSYDPKETLALPQDVQHWSLITLRQKRVKIGVKVERQGRNIIYQLVEIAILNALFAEFPRLIDRLRSAALPPRWASVR